MPAGIFWQSFHGLTKLWSVLQSGLGLALAVRWSGFKILPHLIITMADHAKPTGFYFKLTYAVKKCEWCWDWRNYGRFSPIFLCRIRYLQKNGDPKKKKKPQKTVIFLPTPTTARLCLKLCWWNMFFFMFCFHMRWHDLCLSLWAFVTVVFFSDTELSVLCCHLIPIIRFVLLCVSEMKRLVVTMKACNQHEVC